MSKMTMNRPRANSDVDDETRNKIFEEITVQGKFKPTKYHAPTTTTTSSPEDEPAYDRKQITNDGVKQKERDYRFGKENYSNLAALGLVDKKALRETFQAFRAALSDDIINEEEFSDAVKQSVARYETSHSENVETSSDLRFYAEKLVQEKEKALFHHNKRKLFAAAEPETQIDCLQRFKNYFATCLNKELLDKQTAERSLEKVKAIAAGNDEVEQNRQEVLTHCRQTFEQHRGSPLTRHLGIN